MRPDEARAFVEDVAGRTFGGAFRMLADESSGLDLPGAAAARRANVARYLEERTAQRPVLLVGEAMGYAGGRFTGIAFTAERTLHAWGPPYEATSTRPEGFSEQSGTIVHGLLGTLGVEDRVLSGTSSRPTRTGPARRSRTGCRPRPSGAPAARCCAS